MSNYKLKTIYEGIEEGYISIGSPRSGFSFYPVDDLDAAEAHMVAAAANDQVYHSWGVLGQIPQKGRGTAQDIIALPGILFDWDVKSADATVHSRNEHLPGSLEEIRRLLDEAGVPQPTAVINSGNGYYGRYHFQRPFIANDNDRAAITALCQGMNALIGGAFRIAGFHMDNVSDLPRITRHPGTFNHKSNPAKPVALESYEPENRFEIAELEALIEPARPHVKPLGSRKFATGVSIAPDAEKPNFDSVVAGCKWVENAVNRAAALSEPEWYALGTIIERCEGGEEIFHEISATDPRYDERETAEKLGRATGPRTCAIISSDGFEGCNECAFHKGGTLTTPLMLGTRSPVLAKLMSEYVYVIRQRQYVHLATGVRLQDTQFSDKYRAYTGKNTPHTILNTDHYTRKVDTFDYLPGETDKIVEESGETKLNMWQPGALLPMAGDTGIIMRHLEYLIPDRDERAHLMDILAHAVQKPALKIRHAAIIMGGQGTGKSFLGQLLKQLFGEKNAVTVAGEEILSQWTEKLGNTQALIWEESGVGDHLEAYERMKVWITEETQAVNQKHIVAYEARTPRVILGFTNQSMPVKIAKDDRRFFIVRSPAVPQDKAYYSMLFGDGLDQAPAFLHALLERDVSQFDPSAPPPMTEAKRQLIDDSEPLVIREIKSMMEEGEAPFDCDLLTRERLLLALRSRVSARANVSGNVVLQAMQDLGFTNLGQQRLGNGRRPRLWAWRNADRWATASNGELRSEFMKSLKPY
ncbi:primase-helicase family protein [Devosia sp. Naph2]|uniref:primase-helicase family protein n=1 Tax=Devosia polycyclovorans TaxID=3345148 RepID=UPI0035CFD7E8